MRPAVFLDRDDTLIHCTDITPDGDLGDPALVKLLPGVSQGIAKLRSAGFPLVVVSNQGGVARGRYTTLEVDRVNRRVNELLDDAITRFYYCPWHPKGTVPEFTREHPWRKPQPGMLLQAAQDLELDLARSWMIGDADRDAEAGERAGCRAVLVARQFDPAALTKRPPPATGASYAGLTTLRASSFLEAAELVLRESGR